MDTACEFQVELTEREVGAFAALTGDRNPLHLDPAYAGATEFGRPIAHGALLVGLVSRALGMQLPGRRCLIASMNVQFPKPLFYPATVLVQGALRAFQPDRETGTVHVTITDPAKGWAVLEADVTFLLHRAVGETPAPAVAVRPAARPASVAASGRPKLLVTGGTGGLGSALVSMLSDAYDCCCLTRRAGLSGSGAVTYAQIDLESDGAFARYLDQLDPGAFYGALHLSAPPMGRALASDDLEAVRRHLRHGVDAPLLLARWARRPASGVKRLVLLGSTAGLKFPKPQAGAYSLGKAALEHVARLLTTDLSAQGATVNVVTPTAIPVGMNAGMSERARVSLAGRMPTRRLVEAQDVAGVVRYLLSDAAAQINGATIAVVGGLAE